MLCKHRDDIDGLRGISILLVIFYHLGLSTFSGGFVGVDVFFVVSGYVITNLIYRQISSGEFRFVTFYKRRMRRLLPALIFTLALTFLLSLYILSPQHFGRMSGALFSSILAVSNFYFIGEIGYFDVDVNFKPLIHTWSLAVEEQFYLIWPAFLLLIVGAKSKARMIVVFSAVSIGALISLALWFYFSETRSSFFFTPFRVYEFFFGIVLVFIPELRIKNIYREIIFLIGGGLIAFSTYSIHPSLTHINFYSFVAVVGASLVIFSNNPDFVGELLRNKPMVFIGKISYSLYLIHWPIFVLISYYSFTPIEEFKFTAIALSFAMAILMYFYVETPFRRQTTSFLYKKFFVIMPVMVVALTAFSVHAWMSDGWTWRFSNSSFKNIQTLVENSIKNSSVHFEKFNVDSREVWTNGKTNVLIVGDSHSIDVLNALSSVKENQNRYNFHRYILAEDCFPDENYTPSRMQRLLNSVLSGSAEQAVSPQCLDFINDEEERFFSEYADIIILANHVPLQNMGKHINLVRFFHGLSNAKIVVFGTNYLPYDPPTMLLLKSKDNINSSMYNLNRLEHITNNDMLKLATSKTQASFFDYYPLMCSELNKECVVFSEGRLLYDDDNHWSRDGELYYGKILTDGGIIE